MWIDEHMDDSDGQQASDGGFHFAPGQIVGNYVILECIGAQARSAVYKCHHKDLQRPLLALKVLNPAYAANPNVATRFHQEVVASYSVTHPNVVRTHDFISEGNIVAYTMEYMDCGSLKEQLEEKGVLEIEQVIVILTQLCQGLQAVHEAGIVHRHIKPGNIFFASSGYVKIADFGIAKAEGGPRLTSDGEVLGAVGYASPEYLKTGELDSRSDIYAVGMIGYEMVAGSFPFVSANPVQSLRQRLTSDPPSPTDLRPDCPLELSNIILKALSRDPSRRYQAAMEMAGELEYLGVAASINSITKPRRERKGSFLTRDVAEPFVEMGKNLGNEQLSKLDVLLEGVLNDAFRRRLAFLAVIGVILCLQVALIFSLMIGKDGPVALTEQEAQAAQAVLAAAAQTAAGSRGETLYLLAPGDSLAKVAQRFGITPDQLMELNGINDPKKIKIGTRLRIPSVQ